MFKTSGGSVGVGKALESIARPHISHQDTRDRVNTQGILYTDTSRSVGYPGLPCPLPFTFRLISTGRIEVQVGQASRWSKQSSTNPKYASRSTLAK